MATIFHEGREPPVLPERKDPADVDAFRIDWSQYLTNDSIASSAWTAGAGIVVDSDTFIALQTTVWLSGGVAGTTYTVTNTITTNAGRTLERSFRVVVADV